MESDKELYPEVEVNGKRMTRQDLLPDNVAHKIKGKTLQIYYLLVTKGGKFGVREIADHFGYSSASLASYHLDRLYEHDLVKKTENGKYYVDGDVEKLGKLRDKIEFAGIFVPKILTFAYHGLFSILFGIVLWQQDADSRVWFIYILISNIIFLGFVIWESIKSGNLKADDE